MKNNGMPETALLSTCSAAKKSTSLTSSSDPWVGCCLSREFSSSSLLIAEVVCCKSWWTFSYCSLQINAMQSGQVNASGLLCIEVPQATHVQLDLLEPLVFLYMIFELLQLCLKSHNTFMQIGCLFVCSQIQQFDGAIEPRFYLGQRALTWCFWYRIHEWCHVCLL